jgi:hypothetical protein
MIAATAGAGARQGVLALLLALTFFAVQIPDLFDITRYHGDERFYTDAAGRCAFGGCAEDPQAQLAQRSQPYDLAIRDSAPRR